MSNEMNILAIIIEDALNKCRKQNGGCDNCKLECAWREVGGDDNE